MSSNSLHSVQHQQQQQQQQHGLGPDWHSNTLRKEFPSTLNPSSISTSTIPAASKGKLVKARGGASEAHSDTAASTTTRNRLKKPSEASVQAQAQTQTQTRIPASDEDFSQKSSHHHHHHPSTSTLTLTTNTNTNTDTDTNTNTNTNADTNVNVNTNASATAIVQSISSRPVPTRTQSYSKRHASFDTPREVPLPAFPHAQENQPPLPTFDDSERERDPDWYQQPRHASSSYQRRATIDADHPPTISPPSISSHSPPSPPVEAEETQERPTRHNAQPPQFSRNNSAPTPPHTPSAEHVDLRPKKDSSPDFENRWERSNPVHAIENDDTRREYSGSMPRDTPPSDEDASGNRAESGGDAKGLHMGSSDSRLSTTSLPLPHAYSAERISRLPATLRQSGPVATSTHGSRPLASDAPPIIPEGQVVQNVPSPRPSSEPSEPKSTMGYRSSYPLGPNAREVPFTDALPSPLLQNPAPGTAFRFSSSSLQRRYSADDDDEREAIKRGHTPKLPEIEAPQAVLHPLLATPASRSTVKVPGSPPVVRSHPSPSGESPRGSQMSTGSPSSISTTDRMSSSNSSSGVSSEYTSISQRVSGLPQPQVPRSVVGSASENSGANTPPSSSTNAQVSQSLSDSNGLPNGGSVMTVETTPAAYILQATLPGYQRDEITISTRKKRILHIVADGFVSGGAHFERRVSFGYDADMMRVRAEFNGSVLKITVPRRPTPQSFAASLNLGTPASGNPAFGTTGSNMLWRGRPNMP